MAHLFLAALVVSLDALGSSKYWLLTILEPVSVEMVLGFFDFPVPPKITTGVAPPAVETTLVPSIEIETTSPLPVSVPTEVVPVLDMTTPPALPVETATTASEPAPVVEMV